jgi:hypothetical protein
VGFGDGVSVGQVEEIAAKKADIEAALEDPFNVRVVGPTPSTVMISVVPSRWPAGTLQVPPESGDTALGLSITMDVAERYPTTVNVPVFPPFVKPPENVMLCPTMAGVIPVRPPTVARGVVKLVMVAADPDKAGPYKIPLRMSL